MKIPYNDSSDKTAIELKLSRKLVAILKSVKYKISLYNTVSQVNTKKLIKFLF